MNEHPFSTGIVLVVTRFNYFGSQKSIDSWAVVENSTQEMYKKCHLINKEQVKSK